MVDNDQAWWSDRRRADQVACGAGALPSLQAHHHLHWGHGPALPQTSLSRQAGLGTGTGTGTGRVCLPNQLQRTLRSRPGGQINK
jgi:hypothetical protein